RPDVHVRGVPAHGVELPLLVLHARERVQLDLAAVGCEPPNDPLALGAKEGVGAPHGARDDLDEVGPRPRLPSRPFARRWRERLAFPGPRAPRHSALARNRGLPRLPSPALVRLANLILPSGPGSAAVSSARASSGSSFPGISGKPFSFFQNFSGS